MCGRSRGGQAAGAETVREWEVKTEISFTCLCIHSFLQPRVENMAGLFVLNKEMGLDLAKSETVTSTLPLIPLCVCVCVYVRTRVCVRACVCTQLRTRWHWGGEIGYCPTQPLTPHLKQQEMVSQLQFWPHRESIMSESVLAHISYTHATLTETKITHTQTHACTHTHTHTHTHAHTHTHTHTHTQTDTHNTTIWNIMYAQHGNLFSVHSFTLRSLGEQIHQIQIWPLPKDILFIIHHSKCLSVCSSFKIACRNETGHGRCTLI